MVVEDESIIAESLREALQNLGYKVSAIASTGEGAIRATEETKPDLVLMDIMLKGEMDGIEAAGVITAKLETPVVYLTALADDGTLERAKKTAPLGYILKPFGIEELKTSIEIALHNEVLLKKLKRSHRWLSNAFDGMGYGVIACDEDGRIMFLNVTAERITGWSEKDVFGQALKMVLKTEDGEIIPLPRKGEGSGRGSPMVELRAVEGAPLCAKSGAVRAVDVSPIVVSDDLGN